MRTVPIVADAELGGRLNTLRIVSPTSTELTALRARQSSRHKVRRKLQPLLYGQ